MKRSWLNRRTPLKSKTPIRRGSPLSRSGRIKPIGERKRRQMREGTSYGELADSVRSIGECQAKGELPGPCGWLPERTTLEVCHAGSKNSGQYDWVTDADGEAVGNLWLGCPVHHDYADGHKKRTLPWMRKVARENGRIAQAAGVREVDS